MTNRLSSLPIEPVFCLPFLAAVLLAATIVGSSVAAECNYTSIRENRTHTLSSPFVVSNCLFNQTISFSTTNATQALLPAIVQFVNVTFGVLGTPVGPSFNDVPDFSTFTFQGCLFNSKICFNRTLLALRNITLRLTDVVFNAHGTVMVTSTIGISGIVLDARRITASLVGDTFQLTNGLFLFSARSTAKVLPISDVSVTIADVEGTAVLGSSSVVGGTFIALLDVYTNLLTNITVDAQRVSWNTSGVCIESKLVALNAVSIFGPTTVTMDRITWNSWTFVFLATATTSNSLVAWGSDVMSGPTSVTLTKIHAYVRSEDPTVTVRPAAATASTGKVSIVRADRFTSTTTSIQYAGAFNVTIDNSILTGYSAIRVNVIDFEFGTGPTLHVNLRVASTRTFLVDGSHHVEQLDVCVFGHSDDIQFSRCVGK
ncbi:membrane-associated protein, putative [Bodo saltans]|uniref:Membrane-associated protein, putative n=1 Tax=Bodo saltans TaxID=75058 RepID=A0A0S4JKN5_BODSA|nr:membrane-associated protein, putative [Bodo saltans]|eukprot:CUG92101.1 membrane-associated protein, putative [Bodo saltans]